MASKSKISTSIVIIVAKILVDSKTENPDAIAAAETLSYLRTGIGKISFTDRDIAELRHAVDNKGVKRLVGMLTKK